MAKELGQSENMAGEGDVPRAQRIIMGLDKEEQVFIKDLPVPGSLAPLDVPLLIRNGWVAYVGKWCVLTPRGGNVVATRDLAKEVQNWFHILAQVPKRSALAHLEQKGVIENRQGFPLLTTFGQIVKEQIQVIDENILHHSWRLPADSSDNSPHNPV
jgi:hypothetical protein